MPADSSPRAATSTPSRSGWSADPGGRSRPTRESWGRSFYRRFGKRAFDASVALVGCAVLAIPMGVIAACVHATSGGPALFRQRRAGRDGRPFLILKFRTMVVRPDADSTVTVAGDPRITPIGRHLRRWKLDELPQLFNVLVGEMSLVGPRPDVPSYADRLNPDDRLVLSVRPGITGPATLAFRREEELLATADDPSRLNDEVIFPEKVRINRMYVRDLNFADDLTCILRTVLGGRGPARAASDAFRPDLGRDLS